MRIGKRGSVSVLQVSWLEPDTHTSDVSKAKYVPSYQQRRSGKRSGQWWDEVTRNVVVVAFDSLTKSWLTRMSVHRQLRME